MWKPLSPTQLHSIEGGKCVCMREEEEEEEEKVTFLVVKQKELNKERDGGKNVLSLT